MARKIKRATIGGGRKPSSSRSSRDLEASTQALAKVLEASMAFIVSRDQSTFDALANAMRMSPFAPHVLDDLDDVVSYLESARDDLMSVGTIELDNVVSHVRGVCEGDLASAIDALTTKGERARKKR